MLVALNGILFQSFEWHNSDDGQHYQRLIDMAPGLAARGVTAIWLPPAYKAQGTNDTGYSVYDLYDLGEFDQKGSVRTKYGHRDELLACIKTYQSLGIQVYMDVVLNHRSGADESEVVTAEKMDPENRAQAISDPYEIEAWTHFTFPGRGDQYSPLKLHWYHFTGCDYDARNDETGVFRFIGENKYWADDVSGEYGNYDYLMGVDVDLAHPEIREDIFRWVEWFIETTGADGFRLDAVKHMSSAFVRDLVEHIRSKYEQFFFVAEYWDADQRELDEYLDDTDMLLTVFDVALHFKLHQASIEGDAYDLRTIFDGTSVLNDPLHTVTFVDNHDSQPGQSLESRVEDWFKAHAYALILLREAGYPCVFYGDYCGTGDGALPAIGGVLDKLMALRRIYAKGEQEEYFAEENCIGWVRFSEDSQTSLAVILSNGAASKLRMCVGEANVGAVYADYLGNLEDKIVVDEEGWAEFPVAERSLSCWLRDNMTLNFWEVSDDA